VRGITKLSADVFATREPRRKPRADQTDKLDRSLAGRRYGCKLKRTDATDH